MLNSGLLSIRGESVSDYSDAVSFIDPMGFEPADSLMLDCLPAYPTGWPYHRRCDWLRAPQPLLRV